MSETMLVTWNVDLSLPSAFVSDRNPAHEIINPLIQRLLRGTRSHLPRHRVAQLVPFSFVHDMQVRTAEVHDIGLPAGM